MFYNSKDQILKSTETSTEYRYRRYFFQKVPNIVPSVLFLKSICTVIVGTLKIRAPTSAQILFLRLSATLVVEVRHLRTKNTVF